MQFCGRALDPYSPPFIVAEISGNHAGSLENAIDLITAAKESGADAVKTQCYDADSMTINCNKIDFIVQGGLWAGENLYELYKRACTPPEWHTPLYQYAKTIGIPIFSSIFDVHDLDLLQELECPAYKIASFEITDLPLIQEVAKTKKPMVISTGLASDNEIHDVIDVLDDTPACFLHCTSEYPGTIEGAEISRMHHLELITNNDYPIGISDHTNDLIVPIAATACGAKMIEKHIKLPHVDSADSEFSLDPDDFETMVESVKLTWKGLKYDPEYKPRPRPQFRRSLYAIQDIELGQELTKDNIRSIRPGYGFAPKNLNNLLGKIAWKSFKRGDPIK